MACRSGLSFNVLCCKNKNNSLNNNIKSFDFL